MTTVETFDRSCLERYSSVNKLGVYLRVDQLFYIVPAGRLEDEYDLLLEASGLTRQAFLDRFRAGTADMHLMNFVDAGKHNRQIRRVNDLLRKQTLESELMARSSIVLCGNPDVWEEDNPDALRVSVDLLKALYPDYDISSAKTPWGDLD